MIKKENESEHFEEADCNCPDCMAKKERKFVTTTKPVNPETKKKILTTKNLPSVLPNYHGVKGEEK